MSRLKSDKFRKLRGGKAKVLDLFCSDCDSYLLTYQKDGVGRLLRVYLNRIIAPPEIERLQHFDYESTKSIESLVCNSCNKTIGIPIRHHDRRFAYSLITGSFYKKQLQQ